MSIARRRRKTLTKDLDGCDLESAKESSSDEDDAARLHERHRGSKDKKVLTIGEQMSMQCVWLANGEN